MRTLSKVSKEILSIEEQINELIKKEEALKREMDEIRGANDCKCGIYDKWYRYNSKDDGAAYDKGWVEQNKETQNETVKFLG